MSEEKIKLSQKVCDSLELDPENISKEELEKACQDIMETSRDITKLDIEIEKSDIDELSKYIDSRVVNIFVEGEKYLFTEDIIRKIEIFQAKDGVSNLIDGFPLNYEEFNRCKNYIDMKEVDCILKVSLEELEEIEQLGQIQELQEKYKVKKIVLNGAEDKNLTQEQIEKLKNLNENINVEVAEKIKISNNEHTGSSIKLEEYLQIEEEYSKLLEGIDRNSPDIEKFLEIYKRIANKIEYDHDAIEGTQEYIDENESTSRNSVNGMLKGKCVCAGYSVILCRALSKVGIDCKYISGNTEEKGHENHAWNQVKIDNKWYNTDLTWDRDDIVNGNNPDFCLKSDEEFIMHNTEENQKEKCEESYDNEKIKEEFEEKGFDIEEKQYTTDEILDLLEQLKKESKGIRIGINQNIETGEYELGLGKLQTEECVKWSENEIKLSPEEFSKFINKYIEQKQDIQKQDNIYYKSEDNMQIVIFEDIKQKLLENGIDIDSKIETIIKEKVQQNDIQQNEEKNILKNVQNVNPILGNVLMQNEEEAENKNNQLIEYKPSILSKIKMFFKEKVEAIKQRHLENKNRKESKKENTIENEEIEKNVEKEDYKKSFKEELEVDNQVIQDIQKVASQYQKNEQQKGEEQCTRDSR